MSITSTSGACLRMFNFIHSLYAHPDFLRRVLWLDAILGAATVPSHLLMTGYMSHLLGLPEALLVWSGWLLVAFALFIMLIVSRQPVSRSLVKVLIAGNLLWVAACIELLAVGQVTLTTLGLAYIGVQIVSVSLLSTLEWFGLRKDQTQAAW
ncbi:MAG: hypothetical protein ABIO88_01475 [Burkholderiaceae bacterium]